MGNETDPIEISWSEARWPAMTQQWDDPGFVRAHGNGETAGSMANSQHVYWVPPNHPKSQGSFGFSACKFNVLVLHFFWWTRHTRSWKLRAIRKNRKKRGIFFRRKKVADCDPTNRGKLDVSPRFMAITGDTNELFIGHGGYVIYLYIMVEECLMVKSDSTWKYCNIHGMWYIQ